MPLRKGKSKSAFQSNIRELKAANKSKPAGKKRSMKQILAISYAQQRKGK
jgi:hypothetical protein